MSLRSDKYTDTNDTQILKMKSLLILTPVLGLLLATGCKSMDDTASGKANEGVLPTTETVSETYHQSPAEKKVMMMQLLDREYAAGGMTEATYDMRRQQILESY